MISGVSGTIIVCFFCVRVNNILHSVLSQDCHPSRAALNRSNNCQLKKKSSMHEKLKSAVYLVKTSIASCCHKCISEIIALFCI